MKWCTLILAGLAAFLFGFITKASLAELHIMMLLWALVVDRNTSEKDTP